MHDETVSQRLSRFAATIEWGALCPRAKEKVETHVVDTIGVMLGGSTYRASHLIARAIEAERESVKGTTVVGMAVATTPLAACLVNGTSAHGLELDDGFNGLHPGAPVISSALAAAEIAGATSDEFLAGVTAGYEVAIRTHLTMSPHHRRAGFHPTGTCGTFGAAAAAGRILGLAPKDIANALGLASTQASGIREGSGEGSGMVKRFHAGKAAQNGLLSALLAREGYLAPDSAFEGPYGFFRMHSPEHDVTAALADLGDKFLLEKCYLKPYPACRHIHGPLESVLLLREEHGLSPRDVERIQVHIYREGTFYDNREPAGLYDAQLSIPYVLSVAIVRGQVTLKEFSPDALEDPQVRRLCERVAVVFDSGFDEEFLRCGSRRHKVSVFTTDRRCLEAGVSAPKGSPSNPLTREEVREKFLMLAAMALGMPGAEKAYDAVSGLSASCTLKELLKSLKPDC